MNELEQVERFREGVGEPDELTTARARDAWRTPEATPLRSRPSRRRRRWTVPVGVAAAAIALAVALPSLLPFGPRPDPAAAALLHRFAQIARNAPAEPAPAPGQYVYSKTTSTQSSVFVSGDGAFRFAFREPDTLEQWLGTDGSGRQVRTVGQPDFLTPADRASYEAWLAAGETSNVKASFGWGTTQNETYAPGELSYRDTSGLPVDPDELRSMIEDRQIVDGPSGDWETFVLATDLIRDSYARPALRAALYEVMAGLPGIEVVGDTVDAAGRRGIALASTHDGYRNEVVFDPKTAKILEERTVSLSNDDFDNASRNPGPTTVAAAPAGASLYTATYLSFGGVVDSTTQLSGP